MADVRKELQFDIVTRSDNTGLESHAKATEVDIQMTESLRQKLQQVAAAQEHLNGISTTRLDQGKLSAIRAEDEALRAAAAGAQAYTIATEAEYNAIVKAMEAAQRKMAVMNALGVETTQLASQIELMDAALSSEEALNIADAAANRQLMQTYREKATAEAEASVVTVSAAQAQKILGTATRGSWMEARQLRFALAPLSAEVFPGLTQTLSMAAFGLSAWTVALLGAAEAVRFFSQEHKRMQDEQVAFNKYIDEQADKLSKLGGEYESTRLKIENYSLELQRLNARQETPEELGRRREQRDQQNANIQEKITSAREKEEEARIRATEKDPVKQIFELAQLKQNEAKARKKEEDDLSNKKLSNAKKELDDSASATAQAKLKQDAEDKALLASERQLRTYERQKEELEANRKKLDELQNKRHDTNPYNPFAGLYAFSDFEIVMEQRALQERNKALSQSIYATQQSTGMTVPEMKESVEKQRKQRDADAADLTKLEESTKKVRDGFTDLTNAIRAELAARQAEFEAGNVQRGYDLQEQLQKERDRLNKEAQGDREKGVPVPTATRTQLGEIQHMDFRPATAALQQYHDKVGEGLNGLTDAVTKMHNDLNNRIRQLQTQISSNTT